MIYEKLFNVQQSLKAPKDQFNSFGKYSYRSCEGILEALKPHLAANKLTLTLSDNIKDIGGRIYVEATATLFDIETAEKVSVTAFAREEESKKGMDGSQVTGASSSYARKYAVSGLFAVDDNKDSDVTNVGLPEPKPQEAIRNNYTEEAKECIKEENGTKYAICSNCRGKIYDQPKKDGTFMNVEDYVASCLKVYGRPVCRECRKKGAT